jgi:hypothetical protein
MPKLPLSVARWCFLDIGNTLYYDRESQEVPYDVAAQTSGDHVFQGG